ncbi:hypothetical protein GLV98_07425 [Halobacillus litoralis]|uniref:SLH domain-containing protein n=1 Tax=Halobacillus litoralis TaxID=45668 RepID=A0A845E225_9BACI|nr:S-layer homology domain-containing protein [Halobacillus litoralis]MYL49310.1 hypothetical protein [Halobacillus litoralis]
MRGFNPVKASTFTNLDHMPWAEKVIIYLHEKGIIHGYEDQAFKPEEYNTKAEVSDMIDQAYDIQQKRDNPHQFVDVPDVEWAVESVMDLHSKLIIIGCLASPFKPNKNITRDVFSRVLSSTILLC